MELTIPALVGFLGNDRLEVRLFGLFRYVFIGPSEAELLDDAALHVMEHTPSLPAEKLHRLLLSPSICLRKLTVETSLKFQGAKKSSNLKVRLTAVCTRWSKDGFWMIEVPRVGPGSFAVASLGDLSEALPIWLGEWAKTGSRSALEGAASLKDEHLELIDVDVELPSVLPSRVPKKKRKKKAGSTEKKRKWIPATELRGVAANLAHRAIDGRLSPALGRDVLVDDLAEQLAAEGAAILLVGEAGVGKTAVIEAVAKKLAEQQKSLQERMDLWRVDGARLIAGMFYVGAWESRLARIVHELTEREDVLVVDDLPSLAWTGRSAQSETTMADFLRPHLARDDIRVLAECTPERLEAGRQKNPGFFSCFRVIRLDAMAEQQTYRVLLKHAREVERVRGVAADPRLLETSMALSRRFGPRMAEPGRSVVLLRRFLGEAVPIKKDRLGRGRLGPADLITHFARETGLPRFVLEPGAARTIEKIEASIAQLIVGQETAVATVVDVVAALQQGLDDPDRPVATMLFVGPTGVGKTETAKALALDLFGSADRMLRFDMSEVQGPGALRRLVGGAGAPDGDLTRAVANQPFSVVLLDEIEKAGPAVFDLLLQVLGEGRLTNAVGRTTDFRNTVVVMTSNLGVAQSRRRSGFANDSSDADATHYRRAAQDFFRPEFYNRIDHVVPFRALGAADVEPLVQRIVGKVLGRRGLRRSGVVVHLDEDVKRWIAEEGFDPVYGARSLQRVVERELTVPLARLVVESGASDQGAFIEVWRDTELKMRLDRLASQRVATSERADPTTWAEVGALHGSLSDVVSSVVEHPRWAGSKEERSVLLQAVQTQDDADWEALDAVTALLESEASLTEDLAEFADRWLTSLSFQDSYSMVKPGAARTHRIYPRTRIVTESVPVRVERGRALGTALFTLEDLELRVARLRFRIDHLAATDPFVLFFEPLHDEAKPLANELARAFHALWEGGGLWVEADPGWVPFKSVEDVVTAVSFGSAGLADLLEPDMGLYLEGRDFGGSRLLRLVRVSCRRGEPKAALVAHDSARLAAREARRRGEVAVPLPPVVHRFGVLRPDDPTAPQLATLPRDLGRIVFRRVL